MKTELWIALKSWYLWYSEQLIVGSNAEPSVVNCSQKLISLIFGTTEYEQKMNKWMLWIALKSWYLWYSEQHNRPKLFWRECCELLSKVDIFDIRNNILPLFYFQQQLWIALKSWYLWYSEQPYLLETPVIASCELLSKVDIFDIRNN